jgi:hypothetical protein
MDPISALAAVSSAVALVKKVAETVDDVASLGPVLGKYFDAKAEAIEVVEKSKQGEFKGSALGKAIELEMAIEQARQFEEQIKMLFFQSNKMDVWMRIAARAQNIEVQSSHAARRRKEAEKRKKEEMYELFIIIIGLLIGLGAVSVAIWAVFKGMSQ